MKSKKKSDSGWSLWETLVVLAIIGILALVAVPSIVKVVQQAKVRATTMEMDTIKAVLQIYLASEGQYPDSISVLINEGYFTEDAVLNDEWGTAYSYSTRGLQYTLTSAGQDKEFGTEDDIIQN